VDDRKDSTSPASHCVVSGSEPEPIADDARPSGRCQVDTYCFHGDELSEGVAVALRIMGLDPHCLKGIGLGTEQRSPSRCNKNAHIDLQ
jgi:hypothetical protein